MVAASGGAGRGGTPEVPEGFRPPGAREGNGRLGSEGVTRIARNFVFMA
ncbi:hypothetical protein F4561_005943 [Lipingzhangella halophila]|uniref:Uncharacterized protein n=1 Tax=Lipingzhangella halophila TaxID=1783352 RepID=A0A7W7RN52_9ACTN|nr:hypothetical protein [Lipingzhangella halophila]